MYKIRNFHIDKMSQYEELFKILELSFHDIYSNSTNAIKGLFITMEAIDNAIEHGSLPIQINIELVNKSVIVTVKDKGNGFQVVNKLKLLNEKGAKTLLEELSFSARGRGIYLMYLTAQKVQFNNSGNEVKLVLGS